VEPVKSRLALRTVALGYLAVLLVLPVGMVFYRAFEHGLGKFFDALTTPDAQHAIGLTLLVVAIAVPVNTVFGIITALALERRSFHGRAVVERIIDMPFVISPIVVGLALVLVYGEQGWAGNALVASGIRVIFSLPGIVLATMFVSLPFVVREVAPVLREIGCEQEEAAQTLGASGWQTFWRVTLPAIRPAVAYGVVLTTARALGEFGAVAVVSGHLQGQTETMTLYVQDRFEGFDVTGAYAISVLLAVFAMSALLGMTHFDRRRARRT
jgi:sulfate/thiosulfate transport system permease protein